MIEIKYKCKIPITELEGKGGNDKIKYGIKFLNEEEFYKFIRTVANLESLLNVVAFDDEFIGSDVYFKDYFKTFEKDRIKKWNYSFNFYRINPKILQHIKLVKVK